MPFGPRLGKPMLISETQAGRGLQATLLAAFLRPDGFLLIRDPSGLARQINPKD